MTSQELDKYLFSLPVQQQKEEFLRCKENPVYFIRKYAKIRHPVKGLVSFELWPFQEEILDELMSYRNNLYVKSRQLGLSTLVACYAVWFAFFNRQKSILILATRRDVAKNLLDKVKLAYEELPSFFKKINPKVSDNTTRFLLKNGSEIKCVATTKGAVRSEALSLLIMDEAAFIKDAEDVWVASKPALDSGGSCIVLSSPNGDGNWFHEQYLLGERGEGSFHVRKLMWDLRPDRDSAWLAEVKSAFLKEEDFEQEYCCSFLASGRTVIPSSALKKLRSGVVPPKKVMYPHQMLWIWEEYERKKMYFITVDVSRGDGEDYSVANVWMAEDIFVQVAEFRGKIQTSEFGKIVKEIGEMYGKCLVVVENNSYGTAVLNELVACKYPHIFYSHKDFKKNEGYMPYKNYASDANYKIGVFTSQQTREYFMLRMEEVILKEKVKINSSRMVDELYTFIWNNGKRTAVKGKNDDTVITLSLAAWLWMDVLKEKYEYSDSFSTVDFANMFFVSSKKINSTDQYLQKQVSYGTGKTITYEEMINLFVERRKKKL